MVRSCKAVSAVIGVILMTAITVAIAATVFVYIETELLHDTEIVTISGNITNKYIKEYNGQVYYLFEIEDEHSTIVDKQIYDSYDIGDFYSFEKLVTNDQR